MASVLRCSSWLGHLDSVQQQLVTQSRWGVLLHTAKAVGDHPSVLGVRFLGDLGFEVVDRGRQRPVKTRCKFYLKRGAFVGQILGSTSLLMDAAGISVTLKTC